MALENGKKSLACLTINRSKSYVTFYHLTEDEFLQIMASLCCHLPIHYAEKVQKCQT